MKRTSTGGSSRDRTPPPRPGASSRARPEEPRRQGQRPTSSRNRPTTAGPARPRESERAKAARLRAEHRRQVEVSRFRRPLLLVLGSMVVPGSAQLVTGNRRFGTIVVAVWGGLVGVVALILWQVPTTDLAKWAVQPAALTLFKVMAIVVAVGWIVVIVDAWRLGHPPALARQHRL